MVLLAVGSALAAARSQLADARARDRIRAHDAGDARPSAWSTPGWTCRTTCARASPACERTLALFGAPDDRGLDRASGLGPARPGGSPAGGRGPPRAAAAPGRRPRPAGRRDPGTPPRTPCDLLDRAESIPGLPASRALWLDRARYRACWARPAAPRRPAGAPSEIPATTARDHYLLATSIARQGGAEGLRAAIAELDEALRLNPRHYWSVVQRGICHLERGELVEAAGDFGQCTGLWPEFAWGYFNRGCVLDRAGDKAAAILDYSAALERDPDLVPAYVNRGLARLELKQDAAALADFDRAAGPGRAGRGRLGRARRRPGGAGPARRGRRRVRRRLRAGRRPGRPGPGAAGLGLRLRRRRPRSRRRPGAAFDDALRHDPRDPGPSTASPCSPWAGARTAGAPAISTGPSRPTPATPRPAATAPSCWPGGRLGRGDPRDQRCLEREPRSPATLYAAACVVARAYGALGSDGDRRAGARPPRAGGGRGRRPGAGRRGPRPRRDPPAPAVPSPGRPRTGPRPPIARAAPPTP